MQEIEAKLLEKREYKDVGSIEIEGRINWLQLEREIQIYFLFKHFLCSIQLNSRGV